MRSANADVFDHQVGAAVVVFVDVGANHALGVDDALPGDVVVAAVGLVVLDAEDGRLDAVGARGDGITPQGTADDVGKELVVARTAIEDVAVLQGVDITHGEGLEHVVARSAGELVEAGGQLEHVGTDEAAEGTVLDVFCLQAVERGTFDTGLKSRGSRTEDGVGRQAGKEVKDVADDSTAIRRGSTIELAGDVGDGVGIGLAGQAEVGGDGAGDAAGGLRAEVGGEDVIGDGVEAKTLDFRHGGVVDVVAEGNTIERADETGDLGRGEGDSH